MGEVLDLTIALLILVFLGLVVWSRVMNQRLIDTITEIREIFRSMTEPQEE